MRALYASRGEDAIDLHKAPTLDLRVQAWHADLGMVARVTPELTLLGVLRNELSAFEAERAQGAARCRQHA